LRRTLGRASFLNLHLLLLPMAKNDRIQMPSSGAGITRYFDDYRSKFELKPTHVVIFAIIIILVIVVLHMQSGIFR
jgi:preprotein translocase subunit Sec61beta